MHRAQATGLLSLRRNDPGSWWLVSLTREVFSGMFPPLLPCPPSSFHQAGLMGPHSTHSRRFRKEVGVSHPLPPSPLSHGTLVVPMFGVPGFCNVM